ncbi:carbonyl reductase [NADPH] 1-like [Varroa destructor]|uniref:carbonyl reductase (NADPH) n=1 Tax=Varroa destructor TaxID=109461 RepID=A0A7M7KEN6_VARDE|nr:carbonyl reductase [NADPH] 1-like [Varroa destructor]
MTSVKRVAVVTGANKGIGLSIVKHLLNRCFPGDVILCSRDEDRGRRAVEVVVKECGKTPIFHQLDIDDANSVNKLRDWLKVVYGGLDVLVNNAGIAYKNNSTAPFAEQAEVTVKTNYFGTLRVSETLFPLLRPGARVVHLSSSCGHLSKIPNAELQARFSAPDLTIEQLSALANEFVKAAKNGKNQELGWGSSAYCVSKVLVSALALIHHRQFEVDSREDLIVNSVHPGYVDTDMSSHKGPLTPDQGADAPAYLALLPPKDANNPKGKYIWYDRKIVPWDSNSVPVM